MARPVLFSEIIDSQDVNGNIYVKFTDNEKSKLAGIAEGATAGAAWGEVTGRPTTLSELDNAAAVSLAGKLSKSGGTVTGDITMLGAKILLSGSPSNANEPISLSYFQTHKERSDFQADVKAKQTDGTTVPFQNDVQHIDGHDASAGTYTITFDGQTTGSLNYDDAAATVQSAMEALSNIGIGNITVTGDAFSTVDGGGFGFEFKGTLAKAPHGALTSTADSLTGILDYLVRQDFVGFDVTAGDRYIISDVETMSEDFGTITGIGDNDIIEADAGGVFSVVYDVSERGEGVLVWNSSAKMWLNYKSSTGWTEHGGLSVYTAGNGLQLDGGVFSVKPDSTSGANIVPVTTGANGTGIPIDNLTIKKNEGTGRLYADIAVPQGMYTTGFMHKVTALDVSNGYITFPATPTQMPPIATGKMSSVVVTIPGGSGQVSAARSVYVANDPVPDFSLDPANLDRIIIRTAQAGGITLTDSILEDDVLDIVYTTSGS